MEDKNKHLGFNLGVFLLIFSLLLLLLNVYVVKIPVASAIGSSWLSGWSYRQQHNVTYATGAGINYQMRILIHAGTGSSSGNDTYLGNNCTSFPNDVDFTDDSGGTELKFWIEDTTVDPVTAWLKVSGDLTSINQTIYIYYGKAGQSSLIDGDGTFRLFDSFDGASLDLTKWVGGGSYSQSGSVLILTTAGATTAYAASISTYSIGVAVEVRAAWVSGHISEFGMETYQTDDHDQYKTSFYVGDFWANAQGCSGNGASAGLVDMTVARQSGIYKRMSVLRTGGTDAFIFNDVVKGGAYPCSTNRYIQLMVAPYSAAGEARVDWIAVRKYLSPEPLNGNWGSAEGEVGHYITFRFNYGGNVSAASVPAVSPISNGTVVFGLENFTTYYVNAMPFNYSFVFLNFTSQFLNQTQNMLTYPVNGSNDTIWVWFALAGNGTAPPEKTMESSDLAAYAVAALIFIPMLIIGVAAIVRRRH